MKPRNRNTIIPSLNVRWKLTITGILTASILLAGIFSITGTTATEVCGNGIDDDGDSLIDCEDPDCTDSWDCLVIPIGDLAETGNWAGSGLGPYTATTPGGEVSVTGTVSVSGNANFQATPVGSMGSGAFWQRAIQGKPSWETVIIWDKNPESGTSDIDKFSDDKGTGIITFTFSETVKNPVLHIDRIGGWGGTISSSAKFTVTTPGVSLVRMTGTDDFQVTGTTFFRTPDITTTGVGEAYQSANKGTAAGTIVVKGTFSSVSFSYSGIGVEGTGGDGIEFVWTIDTGSALLPVEWLGSAAEWDGDDARIFWQTARELNSDFFEVERKNPETEKFEVIHKIQAAGISEQGESYEFRDMGVAKLAEGVPVFYRIKQVDMDGKSTYSPQMELFANSEKPKISVFPNPATDKITIQFPLAAGNAEEGRLVVTGINGQKIREGVIAQGKDAEVLDVSGWGKGIYIIQYLNGQQVYTRNLVVK